MGDVISVVVSGFVVVDSVGFVGSVASVDTSSVAANGVGVVVINDIGIIVAIDYTGVGVVVIDDNGVIVAIDDTGVVVVVLGDAVSVVVRGFVVIESAGFVDAIAATDNGILMKMLSFV